MDYSDFRDYCSQEVANELVELGFTRNKSDIVTDASRILLEEAKYFLFHEYDAIYYRIWNNEKGNFEYVVDMPSKNVSFNAKDFNLSSDALRHAISTVINYIKG